MFVVAVSLVPGFVSLPGGGQGLHVWGGCKGRALEEQKGDGECDYARDKQLPQDSQVWPPFEVCKRTLHSSARGVKGGDYLRRPPREGVGTGLNTGCSFRWLGSRLAVLSEERRSSEERLAILQPHASYRSSHAVPCIHAYPTSFRSAPPLSTGEGTRWSQGGQNVSAFLPGRITPGPLPRIPTSMLTQDQALVCRFSNQYCQCP